MDIHSGDVETPDDITSKYDLNSGLLLDTMRCFIWVFVVPVYAAAMSLPPFYPKHHAHLHATHITAALQDDAEWASEEEAAEKGLITTPRDADDDDLGLD